MLQKLEFSIGIKEASSIVCYYDSITQHIHNTCLHSDVAQIWVVIMQRDGGVKTVVRKNKAGVKQIYEAWLEIIKL